MGAVKSLYADVCELLTTAELDEVEIATLLGVDVELVIDIMHDMAYESERDHQPTELTEWLDYDPDC
jgi:DNA-binding ferritin-like protein (Dps family)